MSNEQKTGSGNTIFENAEENYGLNLNEKLSEYEISLIMHQRAVELARDKNEEQIASDTLEIIVFRLAHEFYAIESAWIQEVYPLKDYTPVPCTPSFILGITNIRGQLLSIVDIKHFFGLPSKGLTDLNRVIILRNDNLRMGLLADSIDDMLIIHESRIQSAIPAFQGIRAEYLMGITEDRIIILDTHKILTDPAMIINEEIV
jgi:purine-binding chemotaxis protein CheW